MTAEDLQVPRRIALVTPGYPPKLGGVEQHVARLAAELAELGHNVDVLTHDVDGQVGESVAPGGVRILRFARTVRARHYEVAGGMWRHLRLNAGSYDVVHGHNYHALPLLLAATTAGSRCVLTPHYHGASASTFRDILHRLYRVPGGQAVRRASGVICVSSSEADMVVRDLAVPRARVALIPNGVDSDRLRKATPFPEAGQTALSVGRLDRYKRVDRVIYAMRHLPNLHLRVVGEGDDRGRLGALSRTVRVDDRVTFLGRVADDELARWYRTAQVVVSLSEHEAFGMVAAEALATGTAVALSNIPAHRDLLRLAPERCQLVDDAADSAAVARAISTASELGRVPVDVPNWREVAELTAALYRSVAASPDR